MPSVVTTTARLLSIVEASAMLAPYLRPTNAANWLADMRRKEAHYRDRGASAPACVKHDGVWHYPIEEIERVIAELVAYKKRTSP
jgi:hypothetical protein